jgi:hypothetical protein
MYAAKHRRRVNILPTTALCVYISFFAVISVQLSSDSIMTRQKGKNRTVRLSAYRQAFDRPDNYTNSLVRLTGMPINSAVLPYVNESGVPTPQSALITLPILSQITQTHSRFSHPKRLSSATHRATVALSSCRSSGTFMSAA